MAATALCPHCQHRFAIAGHYSRPWYKELLGFAYSIEDELDKSQTLRCPDCRCEFVASEVKLLGILSREVFAYLLLAGVFCLFVYEVF